jgi:glycosyltransferase involved in cell wall biosynthesis
MLRMIADAGEIALTVLYARLELHGRGSRTTADDLGFPHAFPLDAGRVMVNGNVRTIDFNPTLPVLLERGRFDLVVVSGFVQPTALLGIAWACARGRRYGILSESHALRARSPRRERLRDRLVRPIVSRADVLFPTGKLAAAELVRLGGRPERIVRLPHVPDPRVFHAEDAGAARTKVREELGLAPGAGLVAYVGRLIESKGVRTLLEAHARVHAETGAQLVLAGSGPLESDLRAAAPGGVTFLGFRAPAAVAELLRAADVAVVPSLDEPWGTVVLEELACGCPVVASDRVASAVEILGEHTAGVLVPPGDAAALAGALSAILEDDEHRAELVRGAYSAAAAFAPQHVATAFAKGVRVAVDGRR